MPRKKTAASTPTAVPAATWALRPADWTGSAESIRSDGLIVDVRTGGASLTLKSPLGVVVPLTTKDVAGLETWLGPIQPSSFPPDVPTPCFYIPASYYTSAEELRAKLDRLMPAPLRVWVAGQAWDSQAGDVGTHGLGRAWATEPGV